MRKFILPALGLASVLGAASCSKDFSVAAPYKNITIVSGLMTMGRIDAISDSVQYIRIQKAFLDENKNAIEMAKVPDSSYYPEGDIEVTMREYNGTALLSSTILSRVDLSQEGYTKEDGTFFTSPNYAYKYKHNLYTTKGYSYRLVIKNKVTGEVDSGTTTPISQQFSVDKFTGVANLEFVNSKVADFPYTWRISNPDNAKMYEAYIRFNWIDKNGVTGDTVPHSADWKFAVGTIVDPNDPNVHTLSLTVSNRSFFSAISAAMGPAAGNIQRYMKPCDFFVWTADTAVYNYQLYNQAAAGITGDQVRAVYSNVYSSVQGTHLAGVFGARAVNVYRGVLIGNNSLDSLEVDPTVANLNIRGRAN
ncbi:hypothetical protein ACTHGU_12460 [Chitinophagaceae bacterium MMS25-I14]